jgi:hypothetical protein
MNENKIIVKNMTLIPSHDEFLELKFYYYSTFCLLARRNFLAKSIKNSGILYLLNDKILESKARALIILRL